MVSLSNHSGFRGFGDSGIRQAGASTSSVTDRGQGSIRIDGRKSDVGRLSDRPGQQ